MEESESHSNSRSDVIPEEGHQKPSLKFLNRHAIRGSVSLKWYDVGIELLDSNDIEDLNKIEAQHRSDLDKCCTKMFQLWLKKQPSASWNQLIEALREVELHELANKIEKMLLQSKPEEKHRKHHTSVESQPPLISATSLNADFASLLLNVCNILSKSPNQQDNLETCKDYCSLLRVSGSSNDLLFKTEDIAKLKECSKFKQLVDIINPHVSWDEHSILTQIVSKCKSVEGQEEIEKFQKKLALYQALQIISSTSKQDSEEFAKLCVIIHKPYENVTTDEYKKVKAYIFDNLNVYPYVAVGYIRMLYHSLHIEWLVTVQAVPHMIKSAHQNKDIFIKRNFVFMQIESEVVINDEGTLAQLLSRKQLKEFVVKQKANIAGSNEKAVDEQLLVMEHSRSRLCREMPLAPTVVKIKPAAVVDEFSYVTEQITELLRSHDPKVIVEQCETIMASDHVHGIKLFSDDQIEQLNCYNNAPLILQELSYLWSWSNHSVLRVLVGFCGEAIELLDEFDCHLDSLQPITSYPIFEIIPTNAMSQTTLNVTFSKSIAKITLQDVFDMCSLVVNHCGVTQYCLQLIATQHCQGFVTIYWSIPKCIVNLISSTVLQHSSKFYNMGVIEVVIYPDIRITTGNIAKPKEESSRISMQLQHVRGQYNTVLDENRKLKNDVSRLLACLKTRKERVKELEEKIVKLQEDREEKSKEPLQSKYIETLDKAVQTYSIDVHETQKSLESSLDQKVVQQNSKIMMLEAELETSKKQFKQLSSIHSKCRSQKEKISVGIQTSTDEGIQLEAEIKRAAKAEEILKPRLVESSERVNSLKVQENMAQVSAESQDKAKETLALKEIQLSLQSTIQKLEDALRQSKIEHGKKITDYNKLIEHFKNLNDTEKENTAKLKDTLAQVSTKLQEKTRESLAFMEKGYELQSTIQKLEDSLRQFKSEHDPKIEHTKEIEYLSDAEKESTVKVLDTLAQVSAELQEKSRETLALKEHQCELQSAIQELEDAIRQSEIEHSNKIIEYTKQIQHYEILNDSEKENSMKVQDTLVQVKPKLEEITKELQETQLKLQDALKVECVSVKQKEEPSKSPPPFGESMINTLPSKILRRKPGWWKVSTLVIPNIKTHWKDVALYSLHYDASMVERLEKQYPSDSKKCCSKLLEDWLDTENGVGPKTWETLLTQLHKVKGLADKAKEIIKRLGDVSAL